MMFGGLEGFGRAAAGTLLRWFAFRFTGSARWLRLQASRVDPTGASGPPESPPPEWNPRIWARTGGRTANESRD